MTTRFFSHYEANKMAAALDGIEQAIEDMPELAPEHYEALQQWIRQAREVPTDVD